MAYGTTTDPRPVAAQWPPKGGGDYVRAVPYLERAVAAAGVSP